MMHSNVEPPRPWCGRTPLLTVIWDWDGREPMDLPDQDTLPLDLLRHPAGGRDGEWALLGEEERDEGLDVVESVHFMLRRLIHTNSDFARAALYGLALEQPVVTYADRLLERLAHIHRDDLLPHARWLVSEAAHREPLKLGMLLLGLSGRHDDLVDLRALARHDELTLFALKATELLCDDPTDLWWEIARKARGWGRVHAVKRLSEVVYDRPDVRAWLIRYGCWNTVAPDHLAWICADAGDLVSVLERSLVDRATLEGASLILGTLARTSYDGDMDAYEDGAEATLLFLEHVEARSDLEAFVPTLQALIRWVSWPDAIERGAEPWKRRIAQGWGDAQRARVLQSCRKLLAVHDEGQPSQRA